MPDISAIIPVLGHAVPTEHLLGTLSAVADEILLVDSAPAVEPHAPPAGMRLVERPQPGAFSFGAALAAGVEAAQGELLLFFHSDATPTPEFARAIASRVECERAGLVSASNGRIPEMVACHAFGCRREVLARLGGFDPRYTGYGWSELDLTYSADAAGLRIVQLGPCRHAEGASYRYSYSTCTAKRWLIREAPAFAEKWGLPAFPINLEMCEYFKLGVYKNRENL
jgi:glycosyltransferase involved in cell wall biosynthesis